MKKFVKGLSLFVVIMMVMVIVASCKKVDETSVLTIDSTGKGNKVIRIASIKNGTKDAEDKEHNNNDYMPKGPEAVLEFLKGKIPEGSGATMRYAEEEGYDVFYVEYSFDNLEDYNKKTLALIRPETDAGKNYKAATVTAKEMEDESIDMVEVTFTEGAAIHHASVQWAYDALVDEGEAAGVFIRFPAGAGDDDKAEKDNMFETGEQTVVFNGESSTFGKDMGVRAKNYAKDDGTIPNVEKIVREVTSIDNTPGQDFPVPIPAAIGIGAGVVVIALLVSFFIIKKKKA